MQKSSNKYWNLPAVELETRAGQLRFDGRRWSLINAGEPAAGPIPVEPRGAPLLLSWLMAQEFETGPVEINASPLRLICLRNRARREQWRRLALALSYGPGTSTVSSADSSSSG